MQNSNYWGLTARMAVLIISLTALTAVLTFAQDDGKDAQAGGRLEGSWNVRVTVRDCVTGDPVRSFDSMTQFMQGGTLIDSTSGVPQAAKTPGQGLWEHTVGAGYRFKIKSFGFNSAGAYNGYTIIQYSAQMNSRGDAYDSSGTAEIYAPDGTLVNTLCSTTTATRISF